MHLNGLLHLCVVSLGSSVVTALRVLKLLTRDLVAALHSVARWTNQCWISILRKNEGS